MGEPRDRREADLRLRGYSEKTRVAYLGCVQALARYFGRSPRDLGEDEVRGYLTHLVEARRVRSATHVAYAAALWLLYRITLRRPEMADWAAQTARATSPSDRPWACTSTVTRRRRV